MNKPGAHGGTRECFCCAYNFVVQRLSLGADGNYLNQCSLDFTEAIVVAAPFLLQMWVTDGLRLLKNLTIYKR